MIIAEVVETKTAFKPNQTDFLGNPLPLGSIEVRIGGSESNIGQVRNIFARPLHFSTRRIPLIGEQVILIKAPVNDWSTSGLKEVGFLYFQPINSTDDGVLHTFPKLWARSSNSDSAASRKSDRDEVGYTFPKSPKKMENIQPFEGDDIYEGRFGQSIRFGSTVTGDMSVYDKKPTWKGSSNGDPLMILRIRKPQGSGTFQSTVKKYLSNSKYSIEDIAQDDASIYLTSTQSTSGLKVGFGKNSDASSSPNWSAGSQVILDADRVLLNARTNKIFLIGKEQAIVTGKKVLLQSEKHKVDLDELMDYIKKLSKLCMDLATAKAQYSTACGPTAVATNSSQFTQLVSSDFQKFKQ